MEIVGGFACSHAGLIVTRRDKAPPEQRDAVFGAFDVMREKIEALEPDAIVILATDHMKAWPLHGVPQFAIGVGAVATGLGDAGIEPCKIPVQQVFAQAILEGAVRRRIDLAFTEEVEIDHSFVTPLSLVTPSYAVPIVPVTQNCNVPPRPTLERSHEFGEALRESILDGPPGRVVVVGTGGLSHWVGSESRQEFMRRPAGTRLADLAEHPVEIEDIGDVNAEFDRLFLEHVATGDVASFVNSWSPEQVEETAGNGAQEIRNWLTAAAMMADARATTLAYEPVREWLTGTAVLEFEVD